jgi:uncharacterized protein
MEPNCSAPVAGEPSLTPVPCVVLDTNVVLDWLLFADPAVAALSAAVAEGRLRWIASPPMREELAHVLGGGLAAARGADTLALLRAWDRHVTPAPRAGTHPLRCRDADDQMFVELALASRARWLISRDRAVLALRRRAADFGLQIQQPADWRPQ